MRVCGISFVSVAGGISVFLSVCVFSVGNEPSVPRAGLPSAEYGGVVNWASVPAEGAIFGHLPDY